VGPLSNSRRTCPVGDFACGAIPPARSGGEVDRVFVVESAQYGLCANSSRGNGARRWQPIHAQRGLHAEPAVGADMVVADIFAQDAFDMALVRG
jgi:hypothetical protein